MKKSHSLILLFTILTGGAYGFVSSTRHYTPDPEPAQQTSAQQNTTTPKDTSVRFPVSNQSIHSYEDLNKQYPMDLRNPANVKTTTEYDSQTGNYIIRTKVGELEIATPYTLTTEEYGEYSLKKSMQEFWRDRNVKGQTSNEDKFSVTDMKFSLGPADKIFGPGGVQLKTQGSAELIFGFKSQFTDDPTRTLRARRSNIPNFEQKIQMNVTGSVGDKINFGLNYNTEASFDFDQSLAKLSFKGKEDDIIKLIEAGNVSMPLNGSLITGSSALFGIKTELQFGKLKIAALASQQESQSQTVSSKGGAQTTPFEVKIDQYDENRHFFLGHHFRDSYNSSMSKLPFISSGITINRVEVWITNKQGKFDEARNILAFTDLGEPVRIDNPKWQGVVGSLPSNDANDLYTRVNGYTNIRDINETNSVLSGEGLVGGEDYDKIESARRLKPSDYTLNTALGFISLRSALNPDEVLAVAYDYTYKGKTYTVGEFSNESIKAPGALILKLLKSTSQSPDLASWDLMMKNVYSIGAMQMQQDGFQMNILYRNDSIGTQIQYISEGNIANKNLLQVMNLDRLDSKNATNPDGRFDYVEGYTALSSTGRIIFPVLEPFGEHLRNAIGDSAIANRYVFQELYDSTLVVARELSQKNKFTLVGRYKGSASGSEIRLNAMNIPRGSVVVTAGGRTLTENTDYSVDYTMGTVTILNQSILESNTNIDVKLESQSMFNMQRKSLFGTHLEYEFSKNFTLGGTIMHLSEMPLTKKVNTGNEPIKNTIWGLNTSWRTESQWLTNVLDKIPFVNATQPSSIAFNAEYAQLIPGHSKVISKKGLSYLDDFESTKTNIDIHYPYYWFLASTPSNPDKTQALFPEADSTNSIVYGKNRALLSWYSVAQSLNGESNETPPNLRGNLEAQSDHYTRLVRETELFPNKDINTSGLSWLSLLNLSYYPNERGPYNLDVEGMNDDGTLANPEKRWGGIMRKIEYSDFEASNIEQIEFWMMDPFIYDEDGTNEGGDLYFNLGDISEDILKDGKKAFEHGLPINENSQNFETTVWGRVPTTQSTTVAFDNTPGARDKQDVGLDGLSTQDELNFPTYKNYVKQLEAKLTQPTIDAMNKDPHSPLRDPSGDNYHFYLGSDYDQRELNIRERYKYINGTEGNSVKSDETDSKKSSFSTKVPDIEDINEDNTLNEYERYHQYKVELRPEKMQLGYNYITDIHETEVTLKNGKTEKVKWYQFKIPLNDPERVRVGNIRNFKSIRFMRMFLTGFKQETHLRFATLDLVRGEWREYKQPIGTVGASNSKLDILAVNIEENGRKKPVNYVLPPGVTRETDPSQPQLLQQNEEALVLRATDLQPKESRAVYRNTSYDMRNYKRLQMFVHAEAMVDAVATAQNLQDDELSCFIRLGSDMVSNYYEYEIPLRLTPEGVYSSNNAADREKVWYPENMFDFPFTVLTDAKLERNKSQQNKSEPFNIPDKNNQKNTITVVGNPSISEVASFMIGVRNKSGQLKSGEIWVNELRMSEFDNEGGWAALANLAVNLSDLGSFNAAGRMETAGFGSIESNVANRNMEDFYQVNISAALDLGRFLPKQAKLQIPAYFTYTNETSTPKYDPLDQDIILKDALSKFEVDEQDSLKTLSQSVIETKSFNITNAKVNIRSKKPMFYDPANVTVTYSTNLSQEHTPEVADNLIKQQRLAVNYAHSFGIQPWEPFKNVKALNKPTTKLIKDFNIYYLPTSINYSSSLNRAYSHVRLRDLTGENHSLLDNLSFSKDFMWNRQFDFKYKLTKNLDFGLQTAMNANIEESYYTPEIGKEHYEAWRDTVWNSIKQMGTPYTYQQLFNVSWKLPIDKFPFMDWTSANAQYNSTYNWNRSALMEGGINIGNVASSMGRLSFNSDLNFESLFKKSKFLKGIIDRGQRNTRQPSFTPKTYQQTVTLKTGDTLTIKHNLKSEKLTFNAKDQAGKPIRIKFKVIDASSVLLQPTFDSENASITIISKNPNERTFAQQFADFAIRLPMSVRRLSVNYNQSNSLTLPGFLPEPGFLGITSMDGISAPGWGFVFGLQDDNTLEKMYQRNWLYKKQDIVNPATEAFTSNLDIKATVEPIAGLKIDLTGRRQIQSSTTIRFMDPGMPSTFNGNFSITQIAIKTAFLKTGNATNNYHSETFQQFLNNRDIITRRLDGQYRDTKYPNAGFISEDDTYKNKPFDPTNGTLSNNSPDVLIPAFMAAYTGRDVNKVSTNPFLSILNILPNWTINYNGLSNVPWVKDKFRSINLTHNYTNGYNIGNYGSHTSWVAADGNDSGLGFIQDVQTKKPVPSLAYDISTVSLNESFSPLIGVNVAMKNSMTTNIRYNKQRNLSLNLNSTQLIEVLADEFVVGVGYVVNDFDVVLKLKSSKQQTVKNDLKLNLDFSYKDMKSLLRKINETDDITQASSGNKIVTVRFTADYVFSSKVNLQMFFDRQMNAPLISSSYPVSSTNVGISFKFMLTR